MSDLTRGERLARGAAAVPGAGLRLVFGLASHVRPAAKPLHPSGRLRPVTVERLGSSPGIGVPFVDEPGTSHGVLRDSRATGLPEPLPDIHGLALRVETADGHADVLFATTGRGPVSRFLLVPTRDPRHTASTLLPYRTPSGPVLLAADAAGEGWSLSWSRLGGPWHRFAIVHPVTDPHGATGDASISFDPVTNQLPGLAYYPWAATLREGAYRAARRARGDDRRRP